MDFGSTGLELKIKKKKESLAKTKIVSGTQDAFWNDFHKDISANSKKVLDLNSKNNIIYK